MEFHATTSPAGAQRTGCAVIGVYDGGELSAAAAALDAKAGGIVRRVVKRGDFSGKAGEALPIADLGGGRVERALLVGLGPRKDWSRKSLRRAAATAAEWLKKSGARDALLYLTAERPADVDAHQAARLCALAFAAAFYRIPDLKSGKKAPAPRLARLGIVIRERGEAAPTKRGLEEAEGIARGMALSRDLANLPANVCTPGYLATRARGMARAHKGLRVRVLEARDMKRLGMGSLLSVTQGSEQPPKLIVLEYRGGKAGQAPVALVGKGVTFDTGGISLKQPPGMDEMKFDMTGAASVFGAIEAVASMQARVNVVGIIPACENMPSGRATKPGDIFTSMSGKTIEVLNTDAEGRLILCDALTYSRRFKPRAVVDVATLTGACVIALGAHYSGLFSPDEALRRELEQAGERADDPAWPMPVAEEYAELLKSNFADMANVAGREGGAITAACFLWRFAEGLRWAHLDIAGTAYLTGAKKGSTGRPVPLLVDWLLAQG